MDLIDRQTAISRKLTCVISGQVTDVVPVAELTLLPSAQPDLGKAVMVIEPADVRENRRSEWVLITDNRGQHFECKKCGEWRYHVGQKFCGNCGADMRGDK